MGYIICRCWWPLAKITLPQITHIQGQPFDSSKVYSVALPRNLLNGFCAITPLTQFGESMEVDAGPLNP